MTEKQNSGSPLPDICKPKRTLLRISSVLMLLAALPMLLWCLNLIDSAALDYTYAGAGCFAAAIIYAFSVVTAIAGLAFARQFHSCLLYTSRCV